MVLSPNHCRRGWGRAEAGSDERCYLFSFWLRPCSVSFVVSEVFYGNGRKFDDLTHQHSAINFTKSGFLQPFYLCFVETRQGMTLYCFL